MATIALGDENFDETVRQQGIVLVDFWADWCPPCRAFAPNYDAASEANPDLVFGKVDTEAERRLAGAMGITSIPTIMVYKDGVRVFSEAGALPRPALDSLISQVRGIDMAVVRERLAATPE